eukprot:855879-Prorocentrum_minimum.AAC.1
MTGTVTDIGMILAHLLYQTSHDGDRNRHLHDPRAPPLPGRAVANGKCTVTVLDLRYCNRTGPALLSLTLGLCLSHRHQLINPLAVFLRRPWGYVCVTAR